MIGLGEYIFIFLLAILVFGPKRLPLVARKLGRFFNILRHELKQVQKALSKDIDQ